MTKMSLSFPRMRESISSSDVFPLPAWIPAFARMTKLEHFIFCRVQRESPYKVRYNANITRQHLLRVAPD